MNIFEAMDQNGRAVFPPGLRFAYRNKDNVFYWYSYSGKGIKVNSEDLKRNDWIPDVPTGGKECHVPFETKSANCNFTNADNEMIEDFTAIAYGKS